LPRDLLHLKPLALAAVDLDQSLVFERVKIEVLSLLAYYSKHLADDEARRRDSLEVAMNRFRVIPDSYIRARSGECVQVTHKIHPNGYRCRCTGQQFDGHAPNVLHILIVWLQIIL
jgi:hypothetical protein